MKSNQWFEQLLVETGLRRQFLSNARKSSLHPFSVDRPILDQLEDFDPEGYISNSFSWISSPEGVDYWYLIDTVWIDFLRYNLSFNDVKARIKAIQNLVAGSSRG